MNRSIIVFKCEISRRACRELRWQSTVTRFSNHVQSSLQSWLGITVNNIASYSKILIIWQFFVSWAGLSQKDERYYKNVQLIININFRHHFLYFLTRSSNLIGFCFGNRTNFLRFPFLPYFGYQKPDRHTDSQNKA